MPVTRRTLAVYPFLAGPTFVKHYVFHYHDCLPRVGGALQKRQNSLPFGTTLCLTPARPLLIFFVMALLDILRYPYPRLHKVARPVVTVDDSIRQLVRDMAETMYAAPGIGLAATQVDVHKRVVTIDVSEEGKNLQVFINPEITWSSPECKTYEEGCLSIPGIYDEVKRPAEVKVRALNEKGEAFEIHADGLLAVCIQHEIDHLNGKVFVEYLSNLKQNRIRTNLKKADREAQRA